MVSTCCTQPLTDNTGASQHLNGLESGGRLQDLEGELLERKDQVEALERELHQTNENLAEKVPFCLPRWARGFLSRLC